MKILLLTLLSLANSLAHAADPASSPQTTGSESPVTTQNKSSQPSTQEILWGADLRYRHEYISSANPSTGNSVMNQHRIRARLSSKITPSDDSVLDLRLATSTGRTSTNQTLGTSANAMANYSIMLDRAAFRWNPLKGASFLGGRMANPFYLPGESDLVWDSDLNFDGIAGELSCETSEGKLSFIPGFFWVDKTTTVGKRNLTISSAQIAYKRTGSAAWYWGASLSIHDYAGILDHNGLAAVSDSSGNSAVSSGSNRVYLYDYRPINAGFDITYGGKLTLLTDAVYNPAAISDRRGYLVGLKWGKAKKQGDFAFSYDYRLLERDATVGAFSDGDAGGGGTSIRSHRLGGIYQVGRAINAALTGYVGQSKIAGDENTQRRNRLQADLNFKF